MNSTQATNFSLWGSPLALQTVYGNSTNPGSKTSSNTLWTNDNSGMMYVPKNGENKLHHVNNNIVETSKYVKKIHDFDYLVIIDFEATCDEGETAIVTKENQEVIEFPWIVFDLAKGEAIEEHQKFVRPEWVTELPQFCTQLTGITTEQVQNAANLAFVLHQFDQFVHSRFTSKGKTFCILTDGGWDLKQMLRRETAKKRIRLAEYFNQYFDLKDVYKQCMNTLVDTSLRRMAKTLGITITVQHSGIEDCRTIVKILKELLKRGYKFAKPQVIPNDYDPTADQTFSNDFNAARPAPGTVNSAIVFVRGIPWEATEKDLLQFFSGLSVVDNGILLTQNPKGKFSGTAFIEFKTQEDALQALKRHRKNMGNRYIEVFASNDSERKAAVPYQPKPPKDRSVVLRLRGAPYTVIEQDILTFFYGIKIKDNGILICRNPDGSATGHVYVEFDSEKDGEAAKRLNQQFLGNRYIEIFPSSVEELNWKKKQMKGWGVLPPE